ncbi:oxidoreductase, 2OG-Fe(II) oxygenase family [Metarhizium guizhouense ARSEF 977]|uniref:Oxidoreductase, 2OG-Fe(II) oxygenase family n=1 Tax=Metarhizium guizhouense (strain ARSEF 977) TaxID=1276136 RepID=A0A0B4HA30_METGA|nr:oxidoreductase, 2OG-Fe(II) oxygenase family [Metarhizium guizhouense ARSEF 977]
MSSPEKMASLAVVNYEALAKKDAAEVQKLVTACQTVGMFYLNLRGPSTNAIFEDIPTIFKTGHAFFNLPHDSNEKTQSAREGMERGYHAGKGFEYYEIARDEYQLGKWLLPATFEPEKERITRTINSFHRAIQTVVAELCAALDIRIPELSDDAAIPSDTALKLLYKPPMHEPGHVIHPWHTDFGLATLLWYDEVTTQIPIYDKEGKQTDDWETVPVIDGTVLINVADELAAQSGGRLHSTVHRVVAPPGPKRVRNGIIYLLRPYKV